MRKELAMFPYIIQTLHALSVDDATTRKAFFADFLERCDEDVSFIRRIWWSDKANFSHKIKIFTCSDFIRPNHHNAPFTDHTSVFIAFNGSHLITS